MGGGLTGLYHCRHTNCYRVFHLYRVLFSTKPECSTELLLAADLSYSWLYPSKQAIDRFMLFAHLYILPPGTQSRASSGNWKQILLLALADYRSQQVWIISKVPLMPRSQPGYKSNCIWRVVGGVRERINSMSNIQKLIFAHILTIYCWICIA